MILPPLNWSAILRLPSENTQKAIVFRELMSGRWVPGKRLADAAHTFDPRTRCARLRDLGIPVVSRPSQTSELHEHRIELWFFHEWERESQGKLFERETA